MTDRLIEKVEVPSGVVAEVSGNTINIKAGGKESVRQFIYEHLRLDSVDAFFYFYCDPAIAMRREYGTAVTQATGSKMNLEFLNRIIAAYEAVLGDLACEVPGLPIVRLDTGGFADEAETARATLLHLLPILQQRFKVPRNSVLPHSSELMRREAFSRAGFEEQIKLRGHPSYAGIVAAGWEPLDAVEQDDTYFDLDPEAQNSDNRFDKVVRVRREGETLRWCYKSEVGDRIFSHRRCAQVDISEADVVDIKAMHPELATIRKSRMRYRLEREPSKSEGHFFTLHVDATDIGDFTEIRARGTDDRTHEEELFALAAELGFTPADIVRGSYLGCKKEVK